MNQNDLAILESLSTKGMEGIGALYEKYRDEFVNFARRYRAEENDILDAYQDAIIALYENTLAGKTKELKSSVKTYLFSIGKYILINKLKKKQTIVSDEQVELEEGIENNIEEQINLNYQQKQLLGALNDLGDPCRKLLLLFYYQRYTIEAIMYEMSYQNENTVKASKSRCMKQLKAIVQQKMER